MKMLDHKPLQHFSQITHLKNIHMTGDRKKRGKKNGRMEYYCRDNHSLLETQEKNKLHLKSKDMSKYHTTSQLRKLSSKGYLLSPVRSD